MLHCLPELCRNAASLDPEAAGGSLGLLFDALHVVVGSLVLDLLDGREVQGVLI